MNKWLFIALFIAASSAHAGVHKCQAPDGKVIYTDKGCPQGQDVGKRDLDDGAGPGSRKDSANAPQGGRQDFYREQVKAAERSAPKP